MIVVAISPVTCDKFILKWDLVFFDMWLIFIIDYFYYDFCYMKLEFHLVDSDSNFSYNIINP